MLIWVEGVDGGRTTDRTLLSTFVRVRLRPIILPHHRQEQPIRRRS